MRSSPSSALTSVDLPALGRPTMATRTGLARFGGVVVLFLFESARRCSRRLRHRQLEAQRRRDFSGQIADAFAMFGGDRERIAEAEREGVVKSIGAFVAFGLVGDENDGLAGVAREARECCIGGVTPARASTTNKIRSASSMAFSDCLRIRSAIEPDGASSRPAVSTRRISTPPPRSATPSRRSRVRPGKSETSAARLPVSRL